MEPSQPKPPLTFRHFQQVNAHRELLCYPSQCKDYRFFSLALCGEAGELANKAKKLWRAENDALTGEPTRFTLSLDNRKLHLELMDEAADVINYAFSLINLLGGDVEEVLVRKFNEVSRRPEVGYTAVEL